MDPKKYTRINTLPKLTQIEGVGEGSPSHVSVEILIDNRLKEHIKRQVHKIRVIMAHGYKHYECWI